MSEEVVVEGGRHRAAEERVSRALVGVLTRDACGLGCAQQDENRILKKGVKSKINLRIIKGVGIEP
jgi:hypothetical protein